MNVSLAFLNGDLVIAFFSLKRIPKLKSSTLEICLRWKLFSWGNDQSAEAKVGHLFIKTL